jgi:hypothetical protein
VYAATSVMRYMNYFDSQPNTFHDRESNCRHSHSVCRVVEGPVLGVVFLQRRFESFRLCRQIIFAVFSLKVTVTCVTWGAIVCP